MNFDVNSVAKQWSKIKKISKNVSVRHFEGFSNSVNKSKYRFVSFIEKKNRYEF